MPNEDAPYITLLQPAKEGCTKTVCQRYNSTCEARSTNIRRDDAPSWQNFTGIELQQHARRLTDQ